MSPFPSTAAPGTQLPSPSQAEPVWKVPAVQTALPHGVAGPGARHPPAPSHTPPHTPVPAHSSNGSWPSGIGAHVPSDPTRSQRAHRPAHAVAQQTPSTHDLLDEARVASVLQELDLSPNTARRRAETLCGWLKKILGSAEAE